MTTTSQSNHWLRIASGLVLVLALALVAWWVNSQVATLNLPLGIPGKALEYPLWAAIVGLIGNAVLKATKQHEFVRPGIRMELFLKIGLVLLGAGLNLNKLLGAAAPAVIQGLIMITAVFFFCWWLGGVFKLDNKLRAVMSTAVSICGVSAAVAAAGSVMAKKEQVTYITTLVIVTALPLMVISPLIATALNLPANVAGAWFGGNIDTTAAVVGAGTIYSKEAQEVASVVKATQNALIGFVTFLLALYFTVVVEGKPNERPNVTMIWERFPKFVLGFIIASILFTTGIITADQSKALDALKNWMFTFAFVGMGLELSISELRRMGWQPVVVFLTTTVFNTLLALGVASVLFR